MAEYLIANQEGSLGIRLDAWIAIGRGALYLAMRSYSCVHSNETRNTQPTHKNIHNPFPPPHEATKGGNN